MGTVLFDLRYALRTLRRRPGSSLAAGLSLALGIGASTAVFSAANSLLIRTVPGVTRPERLVEIANHQRGDFQDLSWPLFQQLRAQHAVLEDLAAFALVPVSVAVGGAPTVQGGLAVTGNYVDLLGLRPVLGRAFGPNEAAFPRVAPVALVSHHYWQRFMGAREDAVGQTVRVNGTPVEIIGVLPPGFAGHHVGLLSDVFLPLGLQIQGLPTPQALAQNNSSMLETIGRTVPGVSRAAAQEALTAAGNRLLAERDPDAARQFNARVSAWGGLPPTVRGGATAFLAVLSVLVGLALAMACINVMAVLLARASERRRELAVRLAIGATRTRLARQVVTEAVVLFTIAGAAGAIIAAWAMSLLSGFAPWFLLPGRIAFEFPLDWRVLAFAVTVTVGTGIAFSLLPALQSGRLPLVPALKQAGGGAVQGRTRLRTFLVGVQVAATVLLLVAATLFTRTLHRLETLDPGWVAEGVTIASYDLSLNGTGRERGAIFYQDLLARATALPGIESAGLAAKLPLGGRSSFGLVRSPGIELPPNSQGHQAYLNRVTPGYFRTMRIPLLRGRDFAPKDGAGAPLVAVVNQTMAARLGQRFEIGSGENLQSFEVVGVVADVTIGRLDADPINYYYVPLAQWYTQEQILHLKADPVAGEAVAAAITTITRELDPNLPFPAPRPLTDALGFFLLPQRLAAFTAGAMGLFGLLLAAVGVYGVTAFVVSRRTREIGIRMALGATAGNILTLLTRQGGVAPVIGVAVGLGLGLVFARFAQEVVSGLDPGDPLAFGGVGLTMLLVAAAAIVIPVARVLRAAPMRALNDE